jgi:hypothetical protein
MNDHCEVGRALDRGDAETANLFGKTRFGARHAVLDKLLRLIGIESETERDGERHQAVGRALAAHIEHAFNAVDCLLDRCRDGLGDDLRIGAGILRPHDDSRRHDLRIFGDRHRKHRDEAGHEDENRQHAGEDRAIDEEFGEIHEKRPIRLGVGLVCLWLRLALSAQRSTTLALGLVMAVRPSIATC